ncbi:MAG: rod shape-determining protein MreC [Actinobacteria bacterium]|nr:rod shape-determining protein MreC [Actinomycetota bacterium]
MRPPRRNQWLLLLAVVTTVTLILLDVRGSDGPLRRVSHAIISPFQSVAQTVARPFRGIATSISDLSSMRERNKQLASQNDRLRAQVNRSVDEHRRLAEIQDMLDLAGRGGYAVVSAHVVAWPAGQDNAAAVGIDVGSADGVRPGMSVVTGRGLVGSTVTVTKHAATVRLITDSQAHVGVRVAGSGRVGMTSGVASGVDMNVQLFAAGLLRRNDIVVTRGSLQGVPYVPGLPVGRITAVTGVAGELPRGRVKPFVDLGALDVVAVVVRPPKADPRDALIPTPRPTPTVTVTVTASPSISPSPVAGG